MASKKIYSTNKFNDSSKISKRRVIPFDGINTVELRNGNCQTLVEFLLADPNYSQLEVGETIRTHFYPDFINKSQELQNQSMYFAQCKAKAKREKVEYKLSSNSAMTCAHCTSRRKINFLRSQTTRMKKKHFQE